MRRTKAEAAITRDTVMKAGLEVFSRKGYSAATLEDVAREARLTRGAIYWHFGSKAELFTALEERYSARSVEVVRQAAGAGAGDAGASAVEALRRILTALLTAVETEPELRAVFELSLFKTESSYELSAAEKQAHAVNRTLQDEIAAVIQSGVRAGELRKNLNVQESARVCLALLFGTLILWLQDPQAFSLQASAGTLTEVFLAGVRAKKAR